MQLKTYQSADKLVKGILYQFKNRFSYKIWVCGRLESDEKNFQDYFSANTNFVESLKGF